MPGPSRSKGCHRCRAKKVKCDQEHPACQRCRTAGVLCPGYRPEIEIRFFSMNNVIEERLSRRLAFKEGIVSQEGISVPYKAGNSEGKAVREKMQYEKLCALSYRSDLRSRLSSDWLEAATCRFYADYVIETENLAISPGFMCKLPSLAARVAAQERDSILQYAVPALALVYFSKQVRSQDLELQSRKQYGRGIAELRRTLMRGNLTGDGVIAATVLLNCYELYSGDRPLQRTVWETHSDAMGMLLRARGTSEQFLSGDASSICRIAHSIVLVRKVFSREPPGYESVLWEQSLRGNPPAFCDQVILACIRIARLLPVADAILADDSFDEPGSGRLLDIISAIQQETSSNAPFLTSIESIESTDSTSELPDGVRWIEDRYQSMYCAARLMSLQTLLDLAVKAEYHPHLSHMAVDMAAIRMSALKDLHATVDEIACGTAEILAQSKGDNWNIRGKHDGKAVPGHVSVWPLLVALGIRSITSEQRRLLCDQLETIEATLGVKVPDVVRTPENAYSRETMNV